MSALVVWCYGLSRVIDIAYRLRHYLHRYFTANCWLAGSTIVVRLELQMSSDDSDSGSDGEGAQQTTRERVIARIKRRKEQNEKNRDLEKLRAPVVS